MKVGFTSADNNAALEAQVPQTVKSQMDGSKPYALVGDDGTVVGGWQWSAGSGSTVDAAPADVIYSTDGSNWAFQKPNLDNYPLTDTTIYSLAPSGTLNPVTSGKSWVFKLEAFVVLGSKTELSALKDAVNYSGSATFSLVYL